MGQRSDEIKKHIDSQRSELNENLERLEERVKHKTDWRAQVEKRPMAALGIAFGSGVLLGGLMSGTAGRRPSSSTSRIPSSASSEGAPGAHFEPRRQTHKNAATSRELRRTWDMLDIIRAAMISYGAFRLKEYLDSVIPGFEDHYNRTEDELHREREHSREAERNPE